ncbi:MAG TPA: hypothetical protein VK563_22205 [Puia sp.]|nr:hypothetical protein [Puia sp.]
MELNLTIVDNFWDWFSRNAQDFGDHFDNTVLIMQLDKWIRQLGTYTWEIGPGMIEKNALVISPGGNPELLSKTREIIMHAPRCTDWEYYYAKPPKQWELIFQFKTTDGVQIKVDASDWKYVLLKYEDELFEIIIKAPEIRKLAEIDRLTAAEIALDGILGEEMRMNKICEIDVVEEFDQLHQNKTTGMTSLSDHLKSII